MTSPIKRILIVGATGQQGGATIKALLANPPPFKHNILALTRKATSPSAQKLASNPTVSVVEGDLDNCPAIFETTGQDVDAALLVTMPSMKKHKPGVVDKEIIQGRAFIDAALANNVKHIVFTSVERGGDEKSWTNPTPIPHFITKHEIELYLREKTKDTNTTYTILRPVAFVDNYRTGMMGRVWAAVWAQVGEKRLQQVATKDIGVIAARALCEPDSDVFKNQAFGLAGDELNQKEANEAMWNAKGRPMVQSYWIFAWMLKWMLADFGIMANWFKTDGFGADVEKCRRLNPNMLTFETWLKESQHQ